MKLLLLVTRDPEFQALLESVLPEGWRVHHRELAPKALEFMEEARPDLIVADLDLPGLSGIGLLKSAQQKRPLPPAVIIAPQDLSDADHARLEVQKIRWILRRPVTAESAKQVIDAVLQYQAPPSMNLVEVLATGYTDISERLVKLRVEGQELVLYFGRGQLWAVQHPAFIQGYVRKVAPDAPAYLATPKDFLGALAQHESAAGSHQALAELKQQVCLSLFASVAPEQEFTPEAESVELPSGLVPVDLVGLLTQMVDHLPDVMLADLKKPRVKVHTGDSKVPGDLMIYPRHGYLLTVCATPTLVEQLITTGVMPENQLLSGLYLLLLLGYLQIEPKVQGAFRLTGLRREVEDDAQVVSRQSRAIENLVNAFQLPGQNPYQILGVPADIGFQRISEAFESLNERLREEHLHPEVFHKCQKEVLYLRAKLQEAFLLIQSALLEDRAKRQQGPGEGRPEGAQPDVKVPTEVQKKEADKMLAEAKDFLKEEKLFEADQFLKLAIFHNPKLAEAHNLLGKMHRGNKSPRAKVTAERELTEAVQLAPNEIEYILDLAEFFADNAQYTRCRQFLDRAQTLKQKHPRAQELRKAIKGKN
jgi:CheY-like chemotaxis protein